MTGAPNSGVPNSGVSNGGVSNGGVSNGSGGAPDLLNAGDAPYAAASTSSSAASPTPNPMDRHSYYVTGRRIVLWRHGQTEWNLLGRLQGQTDVALDEVGREQAQTAARLLQRLSPSSIVSSDLSRAADTARALASLVGLDVALDKGLRETYVGTWQGLTDAEIRERFPEEYAAWRQDHAHQRRGGGEIESEVAERAVAAIERALTSVQDQGTLVVVTHGGTARVTIGKLLGLPEQYSGVLGGLSNCSWSVLGEGHRGWRLLEHNAGSLPEPVFGDDR
jgi:probable phosphoglycerate mutase